MAQHQYRSSVDMRTDWNHMCIDILARCGICECPLVEHEEAMALWGVEDVHYRGCTQPFAYPVSSAPRIIDGFLLCRHQGCVKCAGSPEFVVFHYECLTIFKYKCLMPEPDSLHRLWLVAAWRKPWRGAPPSPLRIHEINFDAVRDAATACGFPLLHQLPFELSHEARGYTSPFLLWRYAAAIQMAAHVSREDATCLWTYDLSMIGKWRRGDIARSICVPQQHLPFPMKITVDSHGIQKMRRLYHLPQPGDTTTTQYRSVYVLENMALIKDVKILYKDGCMRLKLPPQTDGASFTNELIRLTPQNMWPHIHMRQSRFWPRFSVNRMDRIIAVTFFMMGGQLIGFHTHVSDDSCALATAKRLPDGSRPDVVWIHVPLSPEEETMAILKLREEGRANGTIASNALAQLVPSLNHALGRHDSANYSDYTLLPEMPPVLVYSDYPHDTYPASYFSAFCPLPLVPENHLRSSHSSPSSDANANAAGPSASTQHQQQQQRRPRRVPRAVDVGSYFSWAPLAGVASVILFTDPDTGFCQGMILEYVNSKTRAVGQCRLGVDDSMHIVDPCMICLRGEVLFPSSDSEDDNNNNNNNNNNEEQADAGKRVGRSHLGMQIEFDSLDMDIERDPNYWTCLPLRGVLKFWFSHKSAFACVEK